MAASMAASIKSDKDWNIGFRAYPIKFNRESDAGHVMYFKQHISREPAEFELSSRMIFVINVPPYCTQECLERLFGSCGKIETVLIQQAPRMSPSSAKLEDSQYFPSREQMTGFRVAYVTYEDPGSLERLNKMNFKEPKFLSTPSSPIATGLEKWCKEYRDQRPKIDLLQKEIDDFMLGYDKNKKIEDEKQKAEEEADDEGWITVSRKGAKPGIARTEKNQTRTLAKEIKKRKRKELVNFYTFQMRESKREHIAELRKKFEEDKLRIAEMKAARKFKPY
ncbi:ribosomal RNA-processing protein 7 homolog A-like [Anneissia japonica]|uniref:ribosomal RNA-processing protein 7 homolog A-like n=1 Tax=Anneissia japonica TaxID=1529436 RepID=UPI00142565DF|nr:ribosomal RNA-processing protein 7 homolog A-like [Anneissia japonica]